MRTFAATLGAAAMLLAGQALAVDLKNEDGKRYDIRLHYDAATKGYTLIEAHSTRNRICDACKVEAVGVGMVEAKGGNTVTIKGGKISVN